MKQFMMLLLAGALISFAACKGDDGAPGPAGVAGPAGPAGPAGAAGQDGEDGNANVKSATFDITSADWTTVDSYRKTVDLQVPILTQDIVDNGAVMVYWQDPGNTFRLALPFSYGSNGGTQSYFVEIYTGSIKLVSTHTASDAAFSGSLKVRVVAISADGMTRPDLAGLDWSDYEAVKIALDLEE